jgi:hypothetical protein
VHKHGSLYNISIISMANNERSKSHNIFDDCLSKLKTHSPIDKIVWC